ncbi:uncharacterized protein LOC133871592 [Alnus glutinosa]|uniref:uncharacterized protein LOC133871592 n=1 Tax=Alnus glutinosa TaxID=3517 RepID=UPI002D788230|nr:uncharacterized protein LOC133871592 [Alnus glutinosa]
MDRSWITKTRGTREYNNGCNAFVAFAVRNCKTPDGKIRCPCKVCRNNRHHSPDIVLEHLTAGRGIMVSYRNWFLHGETTVYNPDAASSSNLHPTDVASANSVEQGGDMQTMLRDAFGMHEVREPDREPQCVDQVGVENVTEEPAESGAQKYYDLLKKAEKPLHGGTKHSKLSATVHLYNLKCMGRLSNNIFSEFLQVINQLLPACDDALPANTYEAKKYLSDIGLGYEKIPACRNDCMLFWKANQELESCTVCGESRWKDEIYLDEDGQPTSSRKKRPVKVLQWFPLISRLQRLFMSEHTAPHMRWHEEDRTKDGVLRHPADGEAWKSFDLLHPKFSADSRNVRLGLTSDGFNPFGNMSTSHSTWPIMLLPYNLPPWMCMKQTSFILSLIIPGPSSPGMDIDVYLQPLIEELQKLWNVGVRTYDASNKQNFQMRAQLMWTINDFPAYADLSGWPNRGEKACPVCMHSTWSRRLKHGKKFCYMGHKRYLPMDHLWRRNKRAFDGNQEQESAPHVQSGDDILRQLDGMVFGDESAGKKREKKRKKRRAAEDATENVIWKKKSEDGQTYLPAACHTMSNKDKINFLKVIKNVKVPDGYASNVSRCVRLKERTISGLKSHDNHVIMQVLLPIALRRSLPDNVVRPLVELSAFFRDLCSTNLT